MPPFRRRSGVSLNVRRVEINFQGVREMLFSPGVRRDLKERADRVAGAAANHPAVTSNGIAVVVTEGDPNVGHRPHVWVKLDDPAGRGIEARHRVLGWAIDAAGD